MPSDVALRGAVMCPNKNRGEPEWFSTVFWLYARL